MPFAVLFIAAIFIVTGFRGTSGDFLHQLESDVSQIVVPIVAIVIIGALGYVPGFKKLSDGFLILILLAMFLTNGRKGFFTRFNNEIRNIQPQQGNVTLGTPNWSDIGNAVGKTLGSIPLLSGAQSLPAG